jgi:hypothetical protein
MLLAPPSHGSCAPKNNTSMRRKIVKPKLGFRNATVRQQIETASRLAGGIQSLLPEQQECIQSRQALEEALAEAVLVEQLLEEYRAKTKAMLVRQKAVMPKLRMFARCCTAGVEALGGVQGESVVLEVGLDLEKSKRVRTGVPNAPTNLRAKLRACVITLLWKNPMRRSIFDIEHSIGSPEGEWKKDGNQSTVTKARFIFRDAVPGTLYWFRVRAWNANGQSDWSSPFSVRAV